MCLLLALGMPNCGLGGSRTLRRLSTSDEGYPTLGRKSAIQFEEIHSVRSATERNRHLVDPDDEHGGF